MRALIILLLIFPLATVSLNILFYYAVIGPSHISFLRTAVGKLLDRGHTVDVVFAVYNELAKLDMNDGVRRIYYIRHADPDYWKKNAFHFSNMFEKQSTPIGEFEVFHKSGYELCKIAIEDQELFFFLQIGNYDIGLSSDYDPCGNILMTAAGVPSIGSLIATPIFLPQIVSAGLPTIASVYGSPLYPEHTGSLKDKIFHLIRLGYYHYVIAPSLEKKYNTLIQNRFGSMIPDVASIERSIDIIFVNSHEILEKQRPMSSKIRYIGGLGVKKAKQLPEEFDKILTDDTVLFSFGTQVPTEKMPRKVRENFVNTFKKFPNVTFLWKYDDMAIDQDLFDTVDNVIRLKWLPQTELLHDNRVKGFISHMGLNSYLETSIAGIPVLAIPLFADQENNAQNAKDRNIGILINRDELTTEKIEHALMNLLNDPKYMANARSISKKMKERPENAEETFINWLEFAARNPKLHEIFQMPGARLTPLYYYCGDVFLFGVLIIFLAIQAAIFKFLKFVTFKQKLE